MDFRPHSKKQQDAIFATERITLCSTGIQFGKSTIGAIKLKMLIHQNPGPGCNYIIVAPTYKILSQATLPAFRKFMEGFGEYKKSDSCFEMHSGAKIWCRTGTDPDSIVGITDVYGIWGDEAGKFTLYFWENILGRSKIKQCPVILTTSLYSRNWLAKNLIPKALAGDKTIHLCQAFSDENPFFPKEEMEEARATMAPARFAMMYGGIPGKMEGLVYDCFDDVQNICDPFELPEGSKVYAGIDWGYTHPFVCIVGAKLPNGDYRIVDEFCKARLTIGDIAPKLHELKNKWNIKRFYAGPDQPGLIEQLRKSKLPITAANNDVKRGIDIVYGLTKTRKLKYFKGATPHLINEKETYHWPEEKDLRPDQDTKDPNPVKQDDDCHDAERYLMISIASKPTELTKPKVPLHRSMDTKPETVAERIKRLKSKRNKKTETW